MFNLNGKTALVTGATGGIGEAIARKLHESGATVTLSGTRTEQLDKLKNDLKTRVFSVPANLSSGEDIDKLVKTAEEQMGKIDILVNNAGLTKDGLLMRMKDEDWDTVISVNLTAIFKLTRAAIKGMMKNHFGRIINISSIVGFTGNAGQINYAASKAGIIGMTKSLALEVASREITVNAIAPGFIKTKMTDVLPDSAKEALLSKVPLKRLGEPEDIASAAVFLSSNESRYITGQTLHINGGMSMF